MEPTDGEARSVGVVARVAAARTDVDLQTVERWFVDRGVPHLVGHDYDGSVLDTWTRALPLLVVADLLLGLNALDLENSTAAENAGAAAAVVATLPTTDDTYRHEFAGDVGREIHRTLAVRSAYRIARGTHPDAPDLRS